MTPKKEYPLLNLTALHKEIETELREVFLKHLRSSDFVSGHAIDEFEDQFAQYLGVKHVVGCSNGTTAIELALRTLDKPKGAKVILPSLTFYATAEAVVHAGYTPQFVDVNAKTETLDPQLLREYLNEIENHSDIAAILPVHLHGHPCDMHEIQDISSEYKIPIVEDAAQAHGAEYNGKKVGFFGLCAAFSFFPGKNLGALGDAGCVATNSDDLANEIRLLRDHGRVSKDEHARIGFNARLDTLQASFLTVKLRKLDTWNTSRRQLAAQYTKSLEGISGLILPTLPDGAESVYHHFNIRHPDRDQIRTFLKKNDVGTGVHYPHPIHMQVPMKGFPHSKNMQNTEEICKTTLSLPMCPTMSVEDARNIADFVKQSVD